MRTIPLHQYLPDASQLVFGCMGLGGSWDNSSITANEINHAHQAIDAALDAHINFFDHADIYTLGKAELVFGKVLKQRPELRQQIYIQSKCGIRFKDNSTPQRYDFSASWIVQSVDGILQRLGIEQLDILQLHRPDPLMDPAELADALQTLKSSGKVAHFGVSNMHRHQIEFLQSFLPMPLVANQLEINLQQLDWLDEGVLAGHPDGANINFGTGTIEYCQQHGLQIQSWGSLSQGLFTGRDVSQQPIKVQHTAQLIFSLAQQYQTSTEAIILAWIMRHPANIQPVIGTTHPGRIDACSNAVNIELTREHWYQLYVSSRGGDLP